MCGYTRVNAAPPSGTVRVITTRWAAEHTARCWVDPDGVQERVRRERYL